MSLERRGLPVTMTLCAAAPALRGGDACADTGILLRQQQAWCEAEADGHGQAVAAQGRCAFHGCVRCRVPSGSPCMCGVLERSIHQLRAAWWCHAMPTAGGTACCGARLRPARVGRVGLLPGSPKPVLPCSAVAVRARLRHGGVLDARLQSSKRPVRRRGSVGRRPGSQPHRRDARTVLPARWGPAAWRRLRASRAAGRAHARRHATGPPPASAASRTAAARPCVGDGDAGAR